MLAAFDKYKSTASSAQLGAAAVHAARAGGASASAVRLADGGDGLLDVFGGPNRDDLVTGPLGTPVRAGWRLDGDSAVVESARASGLVLAGGASGNDPVAATSAGTGELIELAVAAGARQVIVGLGGSACTDGGLPALDALGDATVRAISSGQVELQVCCDVTTRFADAAAEFGPQKGADAAAVAYLATRLGAARLRLRDCFGVDVGGQPGAGAAGGLAGGLMAAGGRLRSGFDVVADMVGLYDQVAAADLVVTGEGRLDRSSLAGKVVGGVGRLTARAGVRVVAVVGDATDDEMPFPVVSLTRRFGADRAYSDPIGCVAEVVTQLVADLSANTMRDRK